MYSHCQGTKGMTTERKEGSDKVYVDSGVDHETEVLK